MPFYVDIRRQPTEDQKRIAAGLLRIKDALRDQGVPGRSLDDRLLIATWNIREFDSSKGGVRDLEPLLYIAEILSAFDLIAVQEIRDDLGPLDRLLRLMGRWYEPVITDVTRGTSGNLERLAFLYDRRKVRFEGLVGEVVLPSARTGKREDFREQFARTPFLVGFSVGWLKFTICTAHIFYGEDQAIEPRRLAEIEHLARFLADQRTEIHDWSRNVLMLGDFNVFATTDATAQAIEKAGFTIPEPLKTFKSNLGRDKHYDQIAFRTPDVQDQLAQPPAGVFEWDKVVYRTADAAVYEQARTDSAKGKKPLAYNTWRTYQMSDHLPMWVELRTDFSRRFLGDLAGGRARARVLARSQAMATQV
jgi:endonuclease/exonuclease/phosphatase family metal-dependent hydrolase